MEPTISHPQFDLEYSEINQNIRFLADVRFKLLAILPALGGAGVFVLTKLGLQTGGVSIRETSELWIALFFSMLGFVATLGLTLYDQRNSELYNALIHRAKHLEMQARVSSAPGGLKRVKLGGQFNERPKRNRHYLFWAGHDLALALVYGPLLGAWLFPILYPILILLNIAEQNAQFSSVGAAVLAAILFTRRLIALDRQELELYTIAANRDGLESNEIEPNKKQAG